MGWCIIAFCCLWLLFFFWFWLDDGSQNGHLTTGALVWVLLAFFRGLVHPEGDWRSCKQITLGRYNLKQLFRQNKQTTKEHPSGHKLITSRAAVDSIWLLEIMRVLKRWLWSKPFLWQIHHKCERPPGFPAVDRMIGQFSSRCECGANNRWNLIIPGHCVLLRGRNPADKPGLAAVLRIAFVAFFFKNSRNWAIWSGWLTKASNRTVLGRWHQPDLSFALFYREWPTTPPLPHSAKGNADWIGFESGKYLGRRWFWTDRVRFVQIQFTAWEHRKGRENWELSCYGGVPRRSDQLGLVIDLREYLLRTRERKRDTPGGTQLGMIWIAQLGWGNIWGTSRVDV